MKRNSKFYLSMTIAYFIFSQVMAVLFLCCLLFLDSERSLFSTCFFALNIFLAEVSFVLVWWSTRFSGRSYEFNTQGITVTCKRKTVHILWAECREVGLAAVQVNQVRQLFFAYATTIPLSKKEKTRFLESRKNDWEHTAFFECDEELLKELVGVLPKQLADEIRVDAWQLGWLI